MRGSDGGEQNLSEEKGPLSESPFFLLRMLPEMEADERKGIKDSCPYFLKIDFSFLLHEGD